MLHFEAFRIENTQIMPCADSSSSISIRLNDKECFVSFNFAKITCGKNITGKTDYERYCTGKSLQEILSHAFLEVLNDLQLEDQQQQFILYLEWDALRTTIAQYLGIEDETIDRDRCIITSIVHDHQEVVISQLILPPKNMPEILSCRENERPSK